VRARQRSESARITSLSRTFLLVHLCGFVVAALLAASFIFNALPGPEEAGPLLLALSAFVIPSALGCLCWSQISSIFRPQALQGILTLPGPHGA
jgi:hypothetical protein